MYKPAGFTFHMPRSDSLCKSAKRRVCSFKTEYIKRWDMMGKYAVIGHPIAHTLSPLIHHANFEAKMTSDEYKALDIFPEQLKFIREIVKEESLDGFNVTIPHKESIMEFLDEVDEGAKQIGAVNTVSEKNCVFEG